MTRPRHWDREVLADVETAFETVAQAALGDLDNQLVDQNIAEKIRNEQLQILLEITRSTLL